MVTSSPLVFSIIFFTAFFAGEAFRFSSGMPQRSLSLWKRSVSTAHTWKHITRLFSSQEQKGDSSSDRPTIAIVGTGAVGGYYGGRLWESGAYDVKFQMRGEHYRQSIANGLNITSVDGDIFIPAEELQAYESTKDIGPVDWVIVALKSSSLDAIAELVLPLLQKETRVLAIMNGLIEDDLIRGLKQLAGESVEESDLQTIECCSAIYGGMALLCSNRLGPGRIDHSYLGFVSGGVGARAAHSTADQEEEAWKNLWAPTTVETGYEPSLIRGRWKKNVWNLPFNGISVAMGGITVDKIVLDPGLRALAYKIMDETIAIANADLAARGKDSSMFLGEPEKELMMNLSDTMGPYKTSTMLDLTNRNSMEVRYLFRKPLEIAEELGVEVPHLETIVKQIEAFQRFYNLF